MKKIIAVFCIVGAVLWFVNGSVSLVACFDSTATLEQLQADQNLADKTVQAMWNFYLQIVPTYMFMGAVFGLIICIHFARRPIGEHCTFDMTFIQIGQRPKTIAEVNTSMSAIILAIIVGPSLALWLMPTLQSEYLAMKSGWTPVVASAVTTLVTSVPIFPFSLFIIRNFFRPAEEL